MKYEIKMLLFILSAFFVMLFVFPPAMYVLNKWYLFWLGVTQ